MRKEDSASENRAIGKGGKSFSFDNAARLQCASLLPVKKESRMGTCSFGVAESMLQA